MLLSLALAPWLGPASALAVSSPALALGHLHRVHVYRPLIDREIALRFAKAAGPAAVVGGLLAAWVPEWLLALALLGGASLAVLQALGKIPSELGRRGLSWGAAGVGFLAASCGGGGVLLPPTLMSAGLRGRAFVANAACGALVVQCMRIVTYASAGLMASWQLPLILAAGLGLPLGNLLGRRLAVHLDERRTQWATLMTLAIAVALGLLSFAKQVVDSL